MSGGVGRKFCEYENNYDFFEGFHPWAQKTLNEHRSDEENIYIQVMSLRNLKHMILYGMPSNQMKCHGKMQFLCVCIGQKKF